MKIPLAHVLLGCCCAFTQLNGCMPMAGPGRFPVGYPQQPIGYPPQPIGVYNPQPYPGAPWYNVGHPRYPFYPGTPVVMIPAPAPGTMPNPIPSTPDTPLPNPDTTPTVPVGLPKPPPTTPVTPAPDPTEPKDDLTAFWRPWPLPPRGNQPAVRSVGLSNAAADNSTNWRDSRTTRLHRASSRNNMRSQQLVDGVSPSPNEDLKYRGGRIIRDLSYVNLYVSGDTQWSSADVDRIDRSLSAAMRDKNLNNVLLQYYNNQPISSTALPSHPLVGYTPQTVSRGDIQNYVSYLHQQGYLQAYDLPNTVFNFLLPAGTVLTVDNQAANSLSEIFSAAAFTTQDAVSQSNSQLESDSSAGLGGYHGSVAIAGGGRIYFSVGVYSQRFTDGTTNGIPVFNEPWKNVVATLYHQLIEARTDPDVEDAIQNSSDLNTDRYLGWVSDSGYEIGDFPISTNVPLTNIITEVPLADGSGVVPVQLPYSNFVHGPEGPIPQPHPLPSR